VVDVKIPWSVIWQIDADGIDTVVLHIDQRIVAETGGSTGWRTQSHVLRLAQTQAERWDSRICPDHGQQVPTLGSNIARAGRMFAPICRSILKFSAIVYGVLFWYQTLPAPLIGVYRFQFTFRSGFLGETL